MPHETINLKDWTTMKFEINNDDNCLPFVYDLSEPFHLIYSTNLEELRTLCKDCVLLGIDTESRPSFYIPQSKRKHLSNQNNRVSLLQIAIRNRIGNESVAIVDLQDIFSSSSPKSLPTSTSSTASSPVDTLSSIISPIMRDPSVIKIGQGLVQDMSQLFTSFHEFSSSQRPLPRRDMNSVAFPSPTSTPSSTTSPPSDRPFSFVSSILDTNALFRVLHQTITRAVSLKDISRQYLHTNLIKTYQKSDWARRPLTDAQLHYAACDALILLRLYDVMLCEAQEISSEFNVESILTKYIAPSNSSSLAVSSSSFSRSTTSSSCSAIESQIVSPWVSKPKYAWKSDSEKAWLASALKLRQRDSMDDKTQLDNNEKQGDDDSSNSDNHRGKGEDETVCYLPLPMGMGKHFHFDDDDETATVEETGKRVRAKTSSNSSLSSLASSSSSSNLSGGSDLLLASGYESPRKKCKMWKPFHMRYVTTNKLQ